ncbi:adenosylcobinamide-GDP ribazoletransferase [Desulfovibrio legallii]|uniref:Adenosylcobinamide-GDP ribazoletransferase n=1 Tax=Desulfovibrio legallii TaxID=571438 RepID=A0A1G7MB34_9BACT|nr:adenosylcobinamide-GDP ribazoletransferase [Desulfovibrio legallii]SDF58479.1 cobalamin-5'-phosphate synthase [Desulfovibrio legallii]
MALPRLCASGARRLAREALRAYDALAFLSRLVPPRRGAGAAALTASVPFFPLAGLVLGLAFALPPLLLLHTLEPAAAPLALLTAAWLWLAAEIWATRGLHWDGLADLGDAAGSGAQGERFWAVLRDSRLGAFGALHLLLAYSGLWALAAWQLQQGHWATLILAPAWGRTAALWLAALAPAREAHSLGGLARAGLTPRLAWGYALLALALLCGLAAALALPFWRVPCAALGQALLLTRMAALARREGGLSGDFLGAAIQWSQLWFLLLTV